MPKKQAIKKVSWQHFTPEFAVKKSLLFISHRKIKNIIDPAAGNAIFLKFASRVWKQAKLIGIDIDKDIIDQNLISNPNKYLFFKANSLNSVIWNNAPINNILSNGGFDLVVGNPPFSSRFNLITEKNILRNYVLTSLNNKLFRSQAVEILFLELFIRIAKNNGIIIILLPDGILSNPKLKYVRYFILSNTKILRIISLPGKVFKNTSAKTSILILKKAIVSNRNYVCELIQLNKTGRSSNSILVNAYDLIDRMDHYFHFHTKVHEFYSPFVDIEKTPILRDYIQFCKSGHTLYGKQRKFSPTGIRFLHSTNITDIGIEHDRDARFIKPGSKMDKPGSRAEINDVLLIRVGNGCLGRSAIVSSRNEIGLVSDCIFRIKVRNISPYYLELLFRTQFGRNWIKSKKHGFMANVINKEDVLTLPIPILSESKQSIIERRYKSILTDYNTIKNNPAKRKILMNKLEKLIIFVEKCISK